MWEGGGGVGVHTACPTVPGWDQQLEWETGAGVMSGRAMGKGKGVRGPMGRLCLGGAGTTSLSNCKLNQSGNQLHKRGSWEVGKSARQGARQPKVNNNCPVQARLFKAGGQSVPVCRLGSGHNGVPQYKGRLWCVLGMAHGHVRITTGWESEPGGSGSLGGSVGLGLTGGNNWRGTGVPSAKCARRGKASKATAQLLGPLRLSHVHQG